MTVAANASPTPTSDDRPTLRFEIPVPSKWRLEVVELLDTTPSVRTLALRLHPAEGNDASARLEYAPGQDLSLSLAGLAGSPVNRRYTIGRYEPDEAIVELEIVAHGDGPGARFLAAARVGDEIEAFGPRGKITLVDGVETHLFFADESSIAASAAMVAALHPGEHAIVVADVAGPAEHRRFTAASGVGLDLRFLDRGDSAADDPARVLEALASIPLDAASTHAYPFGEFHVVSALRRVLADSLGMARISPKPYWRSGQPNGGHGEPARDD